MARILLLETSAATLSVALADGDTLLASRLCEEPRRQASLTAPLVQEVLHESGLSIKDCDAVCVSKGPGSYTGLRVGVSTAKGLAFGASKPLLSVCTLDILAAAAGDGPWKYVIPMIDARRMEVYTAVYSPEGKRLTPVEARVIQADSFAEQRSDGPVLFLGDGALKCQDLLAGPSVHFRKTHPLATDMVALAQQAYEEKKFEDLAYFEPFYLKDFIATVSRKSLF